MIKEKYYDKESHKLYEVDWIKETAKLNRNANVHFNAVLFLILKMTEQHNAVFDRKPVQ